MASGWSLLTVVTLSALLVQGAVADYCTPGRGCWPSNAALQRWVGNLSAATTAYMPFGADPYEYMRKAQDTVNPLKAGYPGLIIYPANEQDLSKVLLYAARRNIRVVAKCSGHDQNGRSSGSGMFQVVMSNFNRLSYDNATQSLYFGSGLNHEQIYQYMEQFGRITVGGQHAKVCPAGCLSGGCHGPFTRMYGLGIDNVLSVRLALYNGTIVNASPTQRPRLFHALLGAGASSFGVIVGFRVRTYPAPPKVYNVLATFTLQRPNATGEPDEPTFLTEYLFNATWWASIPMTISAYIFINTGVVNINWLYLGEDPQAAEMWIVVGPLLETQYFIPTELGVNEFASLYAYAAASSPLDGQYERQVVGNVLVPPVQEMLDGFSAAVLEYTNAVPIWVWYTYGAGTASGTQGCVSAGMRYAMLQVNTATSWLNPAEDIEKLESMQLAFDLIKGASPWSYINEYSSWADKYNVAYDFKTRFFDNYTALEEVKATYDPCNLYTVEHGVGWDRPRAACLPSFWEAQTP